jgi:hypothetical protein
LGDDPGLTLGECLSIIVHHFGSVSSLCVTEARSRLA